MSCAGKSNVTHTRTCAVCAQRCCKQPFSLLEGGCRFTTEAEVYVHASIAVGGEINIL